MNRTGTLGPQHPATRYQSDEVVGPSLSVIVVAASAGDARYRAAQSLASRAANAPVQVVMVLGSEPDAALARAIAGSGIETVVAAPGSTRAEMCDLGMSRATGAIVAVRDDVAVGDCAWMRAFHPLVAGLEWSTRPSAEVAASGAREAVIMDTMVVAAGLIGDAHPARPQVQRPLRELAVDAPLEPPALEMAAIA